MTLELPPIASLQKVRPVHHLQMVVRLMSLLPELCRQERWALGRSPVPMEEAWEDPREFPREADRTRLARLSAR